MSGTTNFEEWLDDGNAPDDFEDAYSLYQATNGESSGCYEVTGNPQYQLFISGPGEGTLKLLSPSAISSFKAHIERFKPATDLSWEGLNDFYRGMAKND